MNENTLQFAWFQRSEEAGVASYQPLPLAQSLWSKDQMHGVAVSGLLARSLEERLASLERTEMVPARYRVDLFRPARMTATTTSATVVREGPRLVLIDATVEQDGEVVARGSATFLLPTANPEGETWSATERPQAPEPELITYSAEMGDQHIPLFASEAPWSNNFADHQNAGRHSTWQRAIPIVLGEECTPFQAVASIADATSIVTNWGSGGVQFINTDIDVALSRLPSGVDLGLRASDHLAVDGVAVGTAEVFDRNGPIGTSTVTSLGNSRRSVDFAAESLERHGIA